MAEAKSLWGLEIFKGLAEEELSAIAGIMSETTVTAGEVVFREDDHGDTLYVIKKGEVDITLRIGDGVEEKLATIREGGAFGEMALVDPGSRSATARAVTECRLLVLKRRDFFELAAGDNALGIKVFLNLCLTLTDRLRSAAERQRQAMLWGHQISGATQLNFYRLIADKVMVEMDLITGKRIRGVVLKVDETRSGHELTLRDDGERLHIVPYHAIAEVAVNS